MTVVQTVTGEGVTVVCKKLTQSAWRKWMSPRALFPMTAWPQASWPHQPARAPAARVSATKDLDSIFAEAKEWIRSKDLELKQPRGVK